MAEKATIFIPDISGFTEFTSTTALDHSAHIVNELLDLIILSNEQDFTLSEVEGDAVLFYRKGEPLSKKALLDQCQTIYRNFHQRLKVIERDTVCQCGACQTATNLTLKFILHFGEIKEIRVAHFTKATGVDMIVAHRLLKNQIDSREYILLSAPCLSCLPDQEETGALTWEIGQEEYPALGKVSFSYADLALLKDRIPEPPAREKFVVVRGEDTLELEIDASLPQVYQHLINVDERTQWMLGVDNINRDDVTERIGMRHNCVFQGLTMENICKDSTFSEDFACYIEQVLIPEMALDALDIYELHAHDEQTQLLFNINWQETPLPREVKGQMLLGIKANLESFKQYCERMQGAGDA